MFKTGKLYINGEWIATATFFDVFDPATGLVIGRAADGDSSHALQAVQAAHEAFPAWANLPAKERSAFLYKWHHLIVDHADELALLMTSEMGKPLPEAKGEVIHASNFVLWYAEEAK